MTQPGPINTSSPPLINRNSTGSLGTPKLHRILLNECSKAESSMRAIVNQSIDDGVQKPSLDESPLKPWIIEMAKTILIYRTSTTACGIAALTGEGVLIKRLPSPPPTLIKWSAPLFIKIRSRGVGLIFGSQKRNAFAVCTTKQLEQLLSLTTSSAASANNHSRPVRGVEFAASCSAGVSEKTDMVSVPFGEELDLVSMSHTTGPIFGVALLSGAMEVDTDKNADIYGTEATAFDILNTRDPPAEFQPIYGEMNRIVNRVERVSSVSRTSASLERYSTGRDPDRVMVLGDGSTVV